MSPMPPPKASTEGPATATCTTRSARSCAWQPPSGAAVNHRQNSLPSGSCITMWPKLIPSGSTRVRGSPRGRAAPRTWPRARPSGRRRARPTAARTSRWTRFLAVLPSGTFWNHSRGSLAVGVDRGRGVVAVLLGDVPGVERLVPRLVRRRGTVEPVAEHLVPEPRERGRVGAVEGDLDGEDILCSSEVGRGFRMAQPSQAPPTRSAYSNPKYTNLVDLLY